MKVFITGASSGIGEALVFEYARRYCENSTQPVVIGLLARRQQALDALQQSLAKYPNVKSQAYAVDVRDHAAMQSAAEDFMQQYGAPNIVIASAGVSSATYSEEASDVEAFHAVFSINVMGMLHSFQPFLKRMTQNASAQQQAQLVGIASVAGIRGLPGAGAYSASKSAVIKYLESLRVEMAEKGIAVTTIAPGYIKTPMTDVNTYPMPFLMPVEQAAKRFVDAIEKKRRYIVIPWQMGWVARLMQSLPNCLWDFLARNAPHKPKVPLE